MTYKKLPCFVNFYLNLQIHFTNKHNFEIIEINVCIQVGVLMMALKTL